MADRGFSLVALGVELGLPERLAAALPWLVGTPLLAALVLVARGDDGDRKAFSLAIVAAIVLTPIVWLHYFALLIVPLALVSPRFAWPWLLLWVFWLTPSQESFGDLWRIVIATATAGAVLAVAARRGRVAPG